MTTSSSLDRQPTSGSCADCSDGLGAAKDVPHGSLRQWLRANPGTRQLWRVGIFVTGLLFVVLGGALAVLPGPLTIPPVLVGLWVWSTEFAWADRFFESFKDKANQAWQHARQHPVTSTVITVGGLVAAVAGMWAVKHYDLADRAKSAIGL